MAPRFFSERGFTRQGYSLEFVRRGETKPRYQHALAGKHDVPGAACPDCGRRLLLMLTLDTRDPRLGLTLRKPWSTEFLLEHANYPTGPLQRRELPLFYCWHCGPSMSYRVTTDGGVDILDHGIADGPPGYSERPELPAHFPRRALRLVPIPRKVQDVVRLRNLGKLKEGPRGEADRRYFSPRHQVGGEPYLMQQDVSGKRKGGCVLCPSGDSGLLATVGDDNGTKAGFVGDAFVQVLFYYCIPCQVVTCFNECD